MTGVISIDHGSKYDPIIPGELDRGGAINTIVPHNITSKHSTGMVTCGFLAQVEKADLAALKQKFPEEFARPFHSFAGTGVESFLYKGEE